MNPVLEPAPLPGGLAGPLHFPSPPGWSLPAAAVLLAAVLLWQLWRWLRRRAARPPAPVPSRPSAPPTPVGIFELLGSLLRRHLTAGSYRAGCHELSGALRRHWEEQGLGGAARSRLTRLTAREARRQLGDRPAIRLLELLSQLQFGRSEPSRNDFEGACKLAAELVSGRKRA